MYVNVAVLKETKPNERRVALTPSVAPKLIKLGAKLHMQSGAGDAIRLQRQAKTRSLSALARAAISPRRAALSSSASSQDTSPNRPSPLGPTRRSGLSTRSGCSVRSA